MKKLDDHKDDVASGLQVTSTVQKVDVAMEARMLRRMDNRILPFVSLLYMFSFLDRVNIGHARLYGLERGLDLEEGQFGWTLSVFFIGYVLFEVPSNLLLKLTSAPVWISRIMVSWGIVTMCLAAVSGYSSLLATRFFLGVAEAGLVPGIVFYLGNWYTRKEQATRIAFFFSASSVAGAFSGLISYAISGIDGLWGLQGWQWIFLLEGLPTVIIGVMTIWVLPASPQTVSWLSEAERTLLFSKLRASHVEMDGKGFDVDQFRQTVLDPKTYLHMIFYIGYCIPFYCMALLMPSIVKDLGFGYVQTMLLTVPPYCTAFIFNMCVSFSSDKLMDRGYHIIFAAFTALVGFLVLAFSTSTALKYCSVCLTIMGTTACIGPALSWSNNNFIGSTRSAVASAMIISAGNLGGAIASQLYRTSESPHYYTSHTINIMLLVLTILDVLVLKLVYKRENRLLSQTDVDDTSPDSYRSGFRYVT